MKIEKAELKRTLDYLIKINSVKIEDLDLSEFEIPEADRLKMIEDWKFIGLSNKAFLEMLFDWRENFKSVLEPNAKPLWLRMSE